MGIHDGHRERLRRRFLNSGLDSFEDHEVLELLLFFSIPRRDTNPIAHSLLDRFGSFSAVLSAPAEDLARVDGVGENTVALFRLLPQVQRRIALDQKEVVLATTEQAGAYLTACFAGAVRECVYLLCLDRKGRLLHRACLGEGGLDAAVVDMREIVRSAINHAASSVILAHNHPSGVAMPSGGDYAATERAQKALEAVDIRLRDHIIVADGDFISLRDSGYL